MPNLNPQILEEFQNKTSFRIRDLFNKVAVFADRHYQNVVSFYRGETKTMNTVSFQLMKEIETDIESYFETIRLQSDNLRNFKFWILTENVENIYTWILNVKNAPKWSRSTFNGTNYNGYLPVEIPLKQGQTLESLSSDILNSTNSDNDWTDLAIQNELTEESYTSEGGNIIKANLNNGNRRVTIKSVVSTLEDDNVLGRDFANTISFEDDDIKTLSPTDTFAQTIETLINVKKGDNPEFKTDGINPKFIVGSNVNNVTYPIIFRDLTNLFSTDDSIKSFSIVDINRTADSVEISFEVENRKGEISNTSASF